MEAARSTEHGFKRELSIVVAVALVGALGALPVVVAAGAHTQARAHPIALLVWLASIAPAAGCICTALRVRLFPLGATVPAAWFALIALVDAFAPRHLATPAWAALAIAGLYFVGAAVGRFVDRPAAGAGVLALAAALSIASPGIQGLSWSPSTASRLLDLSPATLVCECAGLDWMRHPSVYGPVGSDRFQREPWSGALAGPLALVVGCAASLLSARVASSRKKSSR